MYYSVIITLFNISWICSLINIYTDILIISNIRISLIILILILYKIYLISINNTYNYSSIYIINIISIIFLFISNHWLALLLSLELYSLTTYILISYSLINKNISILYILLNLLNSLILISILISIYYYTSSLSLIDIDIYKHIPTYNWLFIYFFFKLAIFPFSYWLNIIYTEIHINITYFFNVISKTVYLLLLPILAISLDNNLIIFLIIITLIIGTIYPYINNNIITIIIYSSLNIISILFLILQISLYNQCILIYSVLLINIFSLILINPNIINLTSIGTYTQINPYYYKLFILNFL